MAALIYLAHDVFDAFTACSSLVQHVLIHVAGTKMAALMCLAHEVFDAFATCSSLVQHVLIHIAGHKMAALIRVCIAICFHDSDFDFQQTGPETE